MAYGEVKNIRRLSLIDRLYNLFQTEGGFKEPPQLSGFVQPVVDMHQFNRICTISVISDTNTTITQNHTVPDGEKWLISSVWFTRTNAGTGQLSCVVDTVEHRLADITSTDSYVHLATYPLQLDEGQSIRVYFGAGTSGTLKSQVVYHRIQA